MKRIIPRYTTDQSATFQNDVKTLLKLSDNNIVRYYANEKTPELLIPFESGIGTLQELHEYYLEPELARFVKQAAKGYQAMHTEGITHNLNPSSIIIVRGNRKTQAKITLMDLGLSRGRTGDWAAPEDAIIGNTGSVQSRSSSSDMFSLGLTLHFILTYGEHAFDPLGSRLHNVNEEPNFKHLLSVENFTLLNLLEALFRKDPSLRPSIDVVLFHPTFWDSKKTLEFITHVGNFLSQKSDAIKAIIQDLNQAYGRKFPGGWKNKLCPVLKSKFTENERFFDYKDNVVALVKFIRDKNQHYVEWPAEFKTEEVFGNSNEEYLDYFLFDRFRALIVFLYTGLQGYDVARKDMNLLQYYPKDEKLYFESCVSRKRTGPMGKKSKKKKQKKKDFRKPKLLTLTIL